MARFIPRLLGLLHPMGTPAAVAAPGGYAMVTSRHRGGVIRLALAGEVDLKAREQLRETLLATAVAPTTLVYVDLADTRFLDCSGIGALVAGHNAAMAAGCRFRVGHARGIVARVLDVTGVATLLGGGDDNRRTTARWQRRRSGRSVGSR
jgi:anti-sigma B factor antagonist